jgi:hypothetical protein
MQAINVKDCKTRAVSNELNDFETGVYDTGLLEKRFFTKLGT